jgi:D-amino-acid oxidase
MSGTVGSKQVSVVGGGVVGLTTAILLQRAGCRVQVFAEKAGLASVSGVAAALWHPFRSDPPALVSRWAARTREHYNKLAAEDSSAGIDLITLYELRDAGDHERPWWSADTPDLEAVTSGLPEAWWGGQPQGWAWRVRAPRAESPVFMPWLERQLDRPMIVQRFESLDEVEGDVVVNCAGLGAKALARDPSMKALYGHVVVCEPGEVELTMSISHDSEKAGGGGSFYVIPRRTEVVIGGVVEASADDRSLVPDPATRESILARARARGFRPGRVVREAVGLRPYRPSVRVERDAERSHVIHNYGHGGSGYTLCWGCAEDVVGLVGKA